MRDALGADFRYRTSRKDILLSVVPHIEKVAKEYNTL